jgi:DnaK suppressor protein
MDKPAPTLTTGERAWLEADLKMRLARADAAGAEHRGGLSRAEHAHELLSEDFDDMPQREAGRLIDQEVIDRDIVMLGELANALRRLDEPGFGTCEDCAEPIPFERLKVEPWALRCVPCQERRDRIAAMTRTSVR